MNNLIVRFILHSFLGLVSARPSARFASSSIVIACFENANSSLESHQLTLGFFAIDHECTYRVPGTCRAGSVCWYCTGTILPVLMALGL